MSICVCEYKFVVGECVSVSWNKWGCMSWVCRLSVCVGEWVEMWELSVRVCEYVPWCVDAWVGIGKFSVGVSTCGVTWVKMHLSVCVCHVCRQKCWVNCSSCLVKLWPHSNWYHPSYCLCPHQDCSPEGRGWVWWSSVASAPCAIGCCEMNEWKERKKGPPGPCSKMLQGCLHWASL